jgi:uncharacterized membrane protein
LLTVFDVAVVYLTWLEYREQQSARKLRAEAGFAP